MRNLLIQVMVILWVTITSCSTFKSAKPNINEEELASSCQGLTKLIEENWKKHKDSNYFEYNQTLLTKLQNNYRECILTLKAEQVKRIFGQPRQDLGDSHISYNLREGCIGFPQNCELLIFAIKNDRVKSIYVKIHELER